MQFNETELTLIRDALNTEIADLVRLGRYGAAHERAVLRERVQGEIDLLQGEAKC